MDRTNSKKFGYGNMPLNLTQGYDNKRNFYIDNPQVSPDDWINQYKEASDINMDYVKPEGEVSTPSVVSSFKDGFDVWGKRVKNDYRYMGAMLDKMAQGDEYLKGVIAKLQNVYDGGLQNQSINVLEERMKGIKSANYQVPFPSGSPTHAMGLGRQQNRELDVEYDVLKSIVDLKRSGVGNNEIGNYIANLYNNGGEATQRLERVVDEYRDIPQTEGWATAANVMGDMSEVAATILGGAISPVAGAILGGTAIGNAFARSAANANREIDLYENESGVAVPKSSRNTYTTGVLATDMILGALMQARYLKRLPMPYFSGVRKNILNKIVNSPNALSESKHLLRESYKSAVPRILNDSKNLALEQGAASSASVISRNALQTLFKNKEDYPELSDIVSDVLIGGATGAATGFALGGVAGGVSNLIKPSSRTGAISANSFKGYSLNGPKQAPLYENGGSLYDFNEAPLRAEFSSSPNFGRWKTQTKDDEAAKLLRREFIEMHGGALDVKTKAYDDYYSIPPQYRQYLNRGEYTKAFYNPKTKEVGVIAQNIYDEAELENVIAQNGYINRGLKSLFGDDMDTFLDNIYRKMTTAESNSYGKNMTSREKATAYLADLARNPDGNPSLWQRVVMTLREMFRIKYNANNISDETVRYMLWKSRNKIKEEDLLEDMINKAREDARFRKILENPKEDINGLIDYVQNERIYGKGFDGVDATYDNTPMKLSERDVSKLYHRAFGRFKPTFKLELPNRERDLDYYMQLLRGESDEIQGGRYFDEFDRPNRGLYQIRPDDAEDVMNAKLKANITNSDKRIGKFYRKKVDEDVKDIISSMLRKGFREKNGFDPLDFEN